MSSFANYIFRENKKGKLTFLEFPIPRKPIITFVGFLVYCSFCNLILLIPLLTKSIILSDIVIVKSISISQLLIKISFYLFCLYGIFCFLFEIYKKNCERTKNNISNIIDNIYFPVILSFLIFLFLSPKGADF